MHTQNAKTIQGREKVIITFIKPSAMKEIYVNDYFLICGNKYLPLEQMQGITFQKDLNQSSFLNIIFIKL